MAKGKWQVFSNRFNGRNVYRVGRLKNSAEPLHGGNVEYYDDENTINVWTDDEADKEQLAERLNRSGL